MSKQMQWYPGHMSKTIKELISLNKKIDIFFVLLDSRAPESSFVDSIKEIVKDKHVVLVFTKTDLVDEDKLNEWIKYYEKSNYEVIKLNLKKHNQSFNKLMKIIKKSNYQSLIPKFAIIGIPNVGKSTLINILKRKASTITENRAGVTKKNSWYQIENKYWLLDTPGILQPTISSEEQGMILASIGSIKIDILPLDIVSELLIKKIHKLTNGINIETRKEFESDNNYFKKIIKNFQDLKYGKLLLDEID